MCCYIGFGLDVNVLSAIEIWRTAGTHTVGAKHFNSLLFQRFVGSEIVEIIGGKISDRTAVGKF